MRRTTFRKLLALLTVLIAATACTPQQIAWYAQADVESRRAVNEFVVREAAAEFGVSPDLAAAIAWCESSMLNTAANGRHEGLFQHANVYWPGRAEAVGMAGAPTWNPIANARAAAWMLATQGTQPWVSSRACWR